MLRLVDLFGLASCCIECLEVIYLYQACDAVFHYQISELKICDAQRSIFARTLRSFIRSSGNETLCGMLDITSQTNVILEGEIKDAKMSSFSSDFQRTLISFEFSI